MMRLQASDLARIKKPAKEMRAIMASAEILSNKDLVTFKELLMANSIQVDALARFLIEKGIISKEDFHMKLKKVQAEYESRKAKGS
jgi:hypothetical protein